MVGYTSTTIMITIPVVVTAQDGGSSPEPSLPVYAFVGADPDSGFAGRSNPVNPNSKQVYSRAYTSGPIRSVQCKIS